MAINWNLITQSPDYMQRAQQGLALGEKIAKYNTDKEMEGVYERLMELMSDPDFNLTANSDFDTLLAQRPELAKAAMTRFELMKKEDEKSYVSDMTTARDFIVAAQKANDPAMREAAVESGLGVLGKRIARLTKAGRTPDDAIRAFQLYQINPEEFAAGVDSMLKVRTGEDYSRTGVKPKDKTANIKDYEYYQGLLAEGKTEQAERFANKSGLNKLSPRQQAALDVESAERKERSKNQTKRFSAITSAGLDAADRLPEIQRALQLLETVETSGFNQALLGAKQFFGVDAANEAELQYRLGTNVLSQLKTIFGSQFTDQEGRRLERLEANYGRSNEANKRILQEAFQLAKIGAERGIRAAGKMEDEYMENEIKIRLEAALKAIEEMKKSGIDVGNAGNNTGAVNSEVQILQKQIEELEAELRQQSGG